MEWKPATVSDRLVSIPDRWLHLHYFEALNILFRAENALRVFVYIVLKSVFKSEWDTIQIETQDDQTITIKNAAAKRIAQAEGFGYLGYQIRSPLLHLNSGELIRLITSDSYWKHFKRYFKGRKEIIRTKLDEIGTIRNSLAHFRPIKNDDVELLKQNVKHTYIGIEECFSEIFGANAIVPTNTDERWYKSLSTLGSEKCELQLFQSKKEEWLRVTITFHSSILSKNDYNTFKSYNVLKLQSPSIVINYNTIKKLCVFMTENIPFAWMLDGGDPMLSKVIYLVFPRQTVLENYNDIQSDLSDMLHLINTECELVQTDNLARGKLIDSALIHATQVRRENSNPWWSLNTDALGCPLSESDPPEYWGDVSINQTDFIAGASKYPWMPSDISAFDFPF